VRDRLLSATPGASREVFVRTSSCAAPRSRSRDAMSASLDASDDRPRVGASFRRPPRWSREVTHAFRRHLHVRATTPAPSSPPTTAPPRMTILDTDFPNAASFLFRRQAMHALFLTILLPVAWALAAPTLGTAAGSGSRTPSGSSWPSANPSSISSTSGSPGALSSGGRYSPASSATLTSPSTAPSSTSCCSSARS